MNQHEVLSRHRLKGNSKADRARKGQRLQKPRQAQSPEMGKFDLALAALYCLDLHLDLHVV